MHKNINKLDMSNSNFFNGLIWDLYLFSIIQIRDLLIDDSVS